ncbi:hypothetical protein GTP45_05725 [Pseudoduganella sp. FT55W]|uniref:Uncharacterized protein n=1 Tax=Duganella rivi TaxID=2666083 RepID=A0A7X4K9T6_9BURK|nr:hypothetical protein [Duganella rivi]MYM66336.1 hypothetical protein [Duganella rivi]
MIDWIPVVFVVFKFLVLGIGMFYAVKWHYDQGKKGRHKERREVLLAAGKLAAGFVLVLLVLGGVTFAVIRMLGMDLNFL